MSAIGDADFIATVVIFVGLIAVDPLIAVVFVGIMVAAAAYI